MANDIIGSYRRRLALREIEPDLAQEAAVDRLQAVASSLAGWKPDRGGLLSMFRWGRTEAPKGLYLHGGVGRGKTMLMDLFFEDVDFSPKTRLHFHEFMADVHDRIARGRATTDGDPIPFVAGEIASESGLVCFDEMQVTDIADAMILSRLFKVLFERGVVLVTTSNAHPDDLYRNGLNRQLFVPFIDLLKDNVDILEVQSAKDFRLDKLSGERLYFTPADETARAELDRHWLRLTGRHPSDAIDLDVKGRKLRVPKASMGAARFNFADLCEQPLGSLDYLRIAHEFHTVLIDGIPVLGPARRNEARRLINLIDTLYDGRVCLIASADAEPDQLYPSGDGAEAFQRTASRLTEMRSEAFLRARANRLGRHAHSGNEDAPKD
ncbi:MAG: cell division protein ZapE [Hyphomicrobiaceae bacterium]|nr:cell division protein ZapE [Hyphomicrobiaceae bacterium]